MNNYKILEILPKEGEYGINPRAPKPLPRLVTKYSSTNNTLGMQLEGNGWFKWLPLLPHHRKVVFY